MHSDHSAVCMEMQVRSVKLNSIQKSRFSVDWKLIQINIMVNNRYNGNLFQALNNDLLCTEFNAVIYQYVSETVIDAKYINKDWLHQSRKTVTSLIG